MRIVFMGTPVFAVGCLMKILQTEHNVVGVITAPDKRSGRGQKMSESAVKKFAIEKKLNILQPPNLKSDTFIAQLKSLNADVFVVVAFRMLPKVVWQIPPKGTFNLHASLLPEYRGAAPINWAIINGEIESGVTTFLIDEKIDTGNILLQEKIEIDETETAGTLHDKLMVLGGDLIVKTLFDMENKTLVPRNQKSSAVLKSAPKIQKEDCQINWHHPIRTIDRMIRGFSPYPTAWTRLKINDKTLVLKIYSGTIKYSAHQYIIGEVIVEKKAISIALKEGFYFPTEVQLAGKRKMHILDFVNGLPLNAALTVK